jgi:DNA repair photolyase
MLSALPGTIPAPKSGLDFAPSFALLSLLGFGDRGARLSELRIRNGVKPSAETGADVDDGSRLRGRGAGANPRNRFEVLHYEAEGEDAAVDAVDGTERTEALGRGAGLWDSPARSRPARELRTVYLRDTTRSLLARNKSPDVPFEFGLNPYRGCEHGCIYCYARPFHEFLGFSAGLDFESRILVKERAPELLRSELSSRRWRPQLIGLSGVTDAYQPIERRLELTRRCLQVLAEFRNPVGIVTKNAMVLRDADVLAELASVGAAMVNISITTLDPELQRRMEPRASPPQRRLEAIRGLALAGVPVRVMVAPVIPGLTDHEIPKILAAAAEAGATSASYITLRLPHGVADLFSDWLLHHYPGRAEKVLARVRSLRGGQLNDSRFGSRMRGDGAFAEQVRQLFDISRRRTGLDAEAPELSSDSFRRQDGNQLSLFA